MGCTGMPIRKHRLFLHRSIGASRRLAAAAAGTATIVNEFGAVHDSADPVGDHDVMPHGTHCIECRFAGRFQQPERFARFQMHSGRDCRLTRGPRPPDNQVCPASCVCPLMEQTEVRTCERGSPSLSCRPKKQKIDGRRGRRSSRSTALQLRLSGEGALHVHRLPNLSRRRRRSPGGRAVSFSHNLRGAT